MRLFLRLFLTFCQVVTIRTLEEYQEGFSALRENELYVKRYKCRADSGFLYWALDEFARSIWTRGRYEPTSTRMYDSEKSRRGEVVSGTS